MKPLVVAIATLLTSATAAAQEHPAKPKYSTEVERALSDVTADDAQVILVLTSGGEQIRLVPGERTPECNRRGKQYRFALVGKGGDMKPGCWEIVPGSRKTAPAALIRLDSGRSLTVPLLGVTVEAG